MTLFATTWLSVLLANIRRQGRHDQHRNALYLILGNLIAAGTGLLFWLLLARVVGLPASEIGIGYAIVGIGATIGVVAKGGLDTALMRSIPGSTREGAGQLLRFSVLFGGTLAVLLSVLVGLGALLLHATPHIGVLGWILAGAIAVLLVVTWLQDAYYLAEGNARFAVQRNLVLSVTRIVLPLPVIALAWYQPVATTWLLALVASALVATVVRRRVAIRTGRNVSRGEFLRRSLRHEASSAFEFLPGLLLAPIVLMVAGPAPAGYFAIVWAAASLLFVLSAAIGRSALAHMVQQGPPSVAAAIRKGVWQHVLIVAPAAVVGILLAHTILSIFGTAYAVQGATTFAILCASILFVAPSYLYLTVLRAADRTVPLTLFPALMLVTLMVLTPLLGGRLGLPGAGTAWLLANAPFGIFAAWKLRGHVRQGVPPPTVGLAPSSPPSTPHDATTAPTGPALPYAAPMQAAKRHATVLVIVDAARADYVRPDSMPFLSGLANQGLTGSLEAPAGFAQRTVLFTGRYPDTSNTFSAFTFDPEHSPFRWLRRVGPFGNLVRPRRVMFPLRVAIAKITKTLTRAHHTDPAWIPPKFLPFFRPGEDMRPVHEPGALGAPSIFDLCRAHGLRFRYLGHPATANDDSVYEALVRDLRASAPYDLYVAQVNVMQQMGHAHGPFSPALQRTHLRALDQRLASIHAALVAGYDSWDLFVCGDHGMAPVERKVNILRLLARAGAKPAKDYVVFVNSTLVVLWYLTDKGRNAIDAVLPTIPGTHVVGPDERRRLRIPSDPQWGDRMLAADPGVLFWPDFFHVKGSTLKGMHGYVEKAAESHGTAVLMSSDGDATPRAIGVRPLVDVFPTLCELLGLPIPPDQEGTSLARLVRDHAAKPPAARPPRRKTLVAEPLHA